jgi:GINS complex subunit 4
MDINLDELETTIDEIDDTNVQLTSAELIEMMEEVWLNEKFAPEILPNKQEIVDCVLGQLAFMEENLATLPCSDFKKGIHQLEVDRIRYLVTSYLRHRLEKIETYVFHTLKQEEQRTERDEESYLTQAEQEFALKYRQGLRLLWGLNGGYDFFFPGLEQHFENVMNFHPGLPFEDWKNQLIVPNTKSFVFLKAKSRVEGVVVDGGRDDDSKLVDLNLGSQLIISYNSVADLVKKGEVRLI